MTIIQKIRIYSKYKKYGLKKLYIKNENSEVREYLFNLAFKEYKQGHSIKSYYVYMTDNELKTLAEYDLSHDRLDWVSFKMPNEKLYRRSIKNIDKMLCNYVQNDFGYEKLLNVLKKLDCYFSEELDGSIALKCIMVNKKYLSLILSDLIYQKNIFTYIYNKFDGKDLIKDYRIVNLIEIAKGYKDLIPGITADILSIVKTKSNNNITAYIKEVGNGTPFLCSEILSRENVSAKDLYDLITVVKDNNYKKTIMDKILEYNDPYYNLLIAINYKNDMLKCFTTIEDAFLYIETLNLSDIEKEKLVCLLYNAVVNNRRKVYNADVFKPLTDENKHLSISRKTN